MRPTIRATVGLAVLAVAAADCGDLSSSDSEKTGCVEPTDCISGFGCLAGVCEPWIDAPGVVAREAFTDSRSFLLHVQASGTYFVEIAYDATAAGVQIDVVFGHDRSSQLSANGTGRQFLSGAFGDVIAGPYILEVVVGSGVTVTEVSVTPNPA